MLLWIYLIYLVVCLGLTIWVGRVLQQNGRVFLLGHCKGDEETAESLNKLLIVGFYLFSFGFISLALRYGVRPTTLDEGIEFLSTKIGFAGIVLGFIHFISIMMRIALKP